MKVLDVASLIDDLNQTRENIDTFQEQISSTQGAIRNVILLEDSLKGKAGESIRSFYQEVHQKLLIRLYEYLIELENVLSGVENAVRSFGESPNGRLEQVYVEEDIREGLQRVEQVTLGLTDEANAEIRSVSDIVALPHLDPGELVFRVQQGERTTREILEQLYDLDHTQTSKLTSLIEPIDRMKKYVNDVAGMIENNSLTIENFNKQMLFESDAYVEMNGGITFILSLVKDYLKEKGIEHPAAFINLNQEKLEDEFPPEIKQLLDKYGYDLSDIIALNVMLNSFRFTHEYNPSKILGKFAKIKEMTSDAELAQNDTYAKVSNFIHGTLDIAGFIPALGFIPDGLNAIYYAAEGDYKNAGLSTIAAIPWYGDGVTAIRLGKNVGKGVDNVKLGDKTPLAPGGGLAAHEAKGGHLIERHIGKTDQQLLGRLKNNPKITGSSTFNDRMTAEKVANTVLRDPKNIEKIQKWLSDPNSRPTLLLKYKGDGEIIGRSVTRNSEVIENVTNAKIILRKDNNNSFILTGYPVK